MNLEVTGTLWKVYDIEQKTETFQAREFVIQVPDGSFPQLVKFQLVQERVGLIDPHNIGAQLTVHFDLRGREWNGKVLTNLNAWKVVGPASPPERPAPSVDDAGEPFGNDYAFEENNKQQGHPVVDDDLPF